MAIDRRPRPESSGDLPQRVPGVNWRLPGQARTAPVAAVRVPAPATPAAPERAPVGPPPAPASGKLPKRVPGTSAFKASPRQARVRLLPVARGENVPLSAVAVAAVTLGSAELPASSRRPVSTLQGLAAVPPPAPAASPSVAQPLPLPAQPPRAPARAHSRRWWLAGLLVVVLAAVAVISMTV
jgi:hypothetical protein